VVEGSTAYNSQRKVAVSPDGRSIAVTAVQAWGESTAVVVKLSRDGGDSWERLPVAGTADAFRSTVAWDGAGRLHLAWTERAGANRQVFYARWEHGTDWLDRRQLSSTAGYSGYPALAVDGADGLHLAWYGYDGSQYQVYYRYRPPGGDWAPAVQATRQVGDANAPAIAVGPDGGVHVAFYGEVEGLHHVFYMRAGPDGWTLPERVGPARVAAALPSLAVRGDGRPAMAFVQGEGAATSVVYAERPPEGGWTRWRPVSPPGERADDPSLAVRPDPAGGPERLVVAYDSPDGGVHMAESSGGDAWRAMGSLAREPGGLWPSLSWAAWPAGSLAAPLHVAWTEDAGGGAYRLALARWEGGRAIRLETGEAGGWWPRLAVAGVVLVVVIGLWVGRRVRREGRFSGAGAN
jgi:hypothetical protein